MEEIFVSKFCDAKWHMHNSDKIKAGASSDLKWCFLVDSTQHISNGLSMGCLHIPVGSHLPTHFHSPQEIYLVKNGKGLLLMEGKQNRKISKEEVVYIPPGKKHGLRNIGSEPLEVFWIFPTDCWEEVEYNYANNETAKKA